MQRILFFYLVMLISCNSSTKQEQESRGILDPVIHEITGEVAPSASDQLPTTDSSVTFKVFRNETGEGFGYDIYIDGKRYVHQPNIPAVAGNRGFSTEADAQKTAAFVAYKIIHNIMPPSVSVEELDSIGIK